MLVGRRGVVSRIDSLARLVARDGAERALVPPKIIQLTGPPHSGKSELLQALALRYDRVVATGWHDFAYGREEWQGHDILSLLVFALSKPRAQFGRLAFPRLLSTLIAVKQDLGNSREGAVRAITSALEDPRSVEQTRGFVTALAGQAVHMAEQAQGGQLPGSELIQGMAADWVLAALRRTRLGRKVLSPLARSGLGPWPGMTTPTSVYETMADISFNLKSADPMLRELGARQPWAAFLEDIQAGYADPGRNLATMLFLDSIDHPAGRAFIRDLATACAERDRHLGTDNTAPLLVVTAGRQPLTWDGSLGDIEVIPLPDLDSSEVADLALQLKVRDLAAAAGAVYALTAGHRGTTEDLLGYCTGKAVIPTDLTRGVELRARLLREVDDEEFEALVTCSPAVDVTQVERIIVSAEEKGEDAPSLPGFRLRGILSELGWLNGGGRVHPCIRNLLLRELARRPPGHEWPWERACQRLVEYPPAEIRGLHSRAAREVASRAYYNLASGHVADAMRALGPIRVEPRSGWPPSTGSPPRRTRTAGWTSRAGSRSAEQLPYAGDHLARYHGGQGEVVRARDADQRGAELRGGDRGQLTGTQRPVAAPSAQLPDSVSAQCPGPVTRRPGNPVSPARRPAARPLTHPATDPAGWHLPCRATTWLRQPRGPDACNLLFRGSRPVTPGGRRWPGPPPLTPRVPVTSPARAGRSASAEEGL